MSALSDFKLEQSALTRLATRDLIRLWDSLPDLSSQQAAYRSVRSLVGAIVDAYGEQAAQSAVRYLEEHRDTTGVRLPTPVVAGMPPAEQLDKSVSWNLRNLAPDTGNQALRNTIGSLVRFVQQPARDTVYQSTIAARTRFARGTDSDPCPWCSMLASRGAVYHTAESAGGSNDWHDLCGCYPVEVLVDDDLPEESRILQDLWREHTDATSTVAQQQADWTAFWNER